MNVEFVDTNILIYAYDAKAGAKHQKSAELIGHLTNEDYGAVSLQVLSEFYSIATVKLGMASALAEGVIVNFSAWTIHRPAHEDLIRAVGLRRRYNINWWDALILNSALELGCDVLWTEDFSNGQQYGTVTVRNPFA